VPARSTVGCWCTRPTHRLRPPVGRPRSSRPPRARPSCCTPAPQAGWCGRHATRLRGPRDPPISRRVRPCPADVGRQAERAFVKEDQAGSAPLGVCLIRGQRSATLRSIAAWSRSAARRLGRCTVQPSRWCNSAHSWAGWWRTPVSRRITSAIRSNVHSWPVNPLAVAPASRVCSTVAAAGRTAAAPGRSDLCCAAHRCRWPASGRARRSRPGRRRRAGRRPLLGGRRRRTARPRATGGPGAGRVPVVPQGRRGRIGTPPILTRQATHLQFGPHPAAPVAPSRTAPSAICLQGCAQRVSTPDRRQRSSSDHRRPTGEDVNG
jgi:hypothetical protein